MKPEKSTLQDLRLRTRKYALRIIALAQSLSRSGTGRVIASQVLRSGTSVGANYAEAFRSRSKADFVSKHGICLQELEETLYWLDLICDAGLVKESRLEPLRTETNELIAIFVTTIRSAKANQ